MKKVFIFVITLILLTALTMPIQAATKTVTTDLYVRQKPTADSPFIKVLPQGMIIETIENGSDWDRVEAEDCVGYVCNKYLAATEVNESEVATDDQETQVAVSAQKIYTKEEFIHQGVINWNGWNWTYYLLSMFPGSTSTPVQGKHVNEDQFVCDGDGYVILASVDLPPYTVVETPFGYMGKVYDTGCPSGVLDVYTDFY